mgnify:CR=1 FL=1
MAATSQVASSVFAGHPRVGQQALPSEIEQTATQSASAEQTDGQTTKDEEKRQLNPEASRVPSSDEGTLLNEASHVSNIEPPAIQRSHTAPFPNGYHFPPKYSWKEMMMQGLEHFWKFFTTPMGFFWTIYGLNIVAWGGMLFLLLCNAAPAMCHPTCDDINSPRRKWIEWDSQILTALFCVTAFGLAPWRFRDLYYLLQYRLLGKQEGLRKLAGIHNGWFRLPGTQELAVDIGPDNIPDHVPRECIPIPEKSMPSAPLTGVRAPATKGWKLDLVIWCMVWNTFAQCGLCGIMWGMNRHTRPSWATGFLVAIACIIAMVGGLVMFLEGRKVKSIEGVPLTERDLERLARDKELGIPHYNNLKDKKPKEKKDKAKDKERSNNREREATDN